MIAMKAGWLCLDCESLFDEPEIVAQRVNYDGEMGWDTWRTAYCPCCGSDAIKEYDDYEEDEEL